MNIVSRLLMTAAVVLAAAMKRVASTALLRVATHVFSPLTIWAAVGSKPIEEIQEGDIVWAQSDQTGEVALKRVKQTFRNVAAALVILHCGTNTLEATPLHPLWVADKGWMAAEQVNVGDELWKLAGRPVEVTGIERRQGQFTV